MSKHNPRTNCSIVDQLIVMDTFCCCLNLHGYAGVEFGTRHVQVLFEVVQTGLSNGVSIDVVEKVHDAETRLFILVSNSVMSVDSRESGLTMIQRSSFLTSLISAGSVFLAVPV